MNWKMRKRLGLDSPYFLWEDFKGWLKYDIGRRKIGKRICKLLKRHSKKLEVHFKEDLCSRCGAVVNSRHGITLKVIL